MGVPDLTSSGEGKLDPWRVRLHHRNGAVLGAGILVTERNVLTCAHVLPAGTEQDVDWPVSVTGTARGARVRARVADGGWVAVPPVEDSDTVGDLALLELERPVRITPAEVRRQYPLPGRRVRLCGYPGLRDAGIWVDAVVAGPSGSWAQLNLLRAGDVEPGFSGAGVVDLENGAVIGMVVARPEGPDARPMCWMVPMSAVVGRLPALESVVTGAKSADDTFLAYRETVLGGDLAEPVHRLVGALTSAGDGRLVVAFSAHDERRAAAFGLLVTTADREVRAGLRADLLTGPRGRLPTAGSVDIAIDATGRTTRDVTSRLALSVGITAEDPGELVRALGDAAKSLTLVVDSVDAAAEPGPLFEDLLVPLAVAGARILAGARSINLPASATAQVATVDLDTPADADVPPILPYLPAAERLERLDGLVEQAAAAATAAITRRAEVAERVKHTPTLTDHVTSLRLKVADLRQQVERQPAHRRNGPDVHEAIAGAERRVYRVRRHAEQFRVRVNRLLDRRDELRGRLAGYHLLATTEGLGEHIEPARRYERARDLLWHAPCDLDAADAAVTAYIGAVEAKRGTRA